MILQHRPAEHSAAALQQSSSCRYCATNHHPLRVPSGVNTHLPNTNAGCYHSNGSLSERKLLRHLLSLWYKNTIVCYSNHASWKTAKVKNWTLPGPHKSANCCSFWRLTSCWITTV
jgi:hypothetical protein